MAITLPLPPKGAAGRSPPLGQLKAGSPEGEWVGGPGLLRGHRGVCAWVTGVWEFTDFCLPKRGPVKHLTPAN